MVKNDTYHQIECVECTRLFTPNFEDGSLINDPNDPDEKIAICPGCKTQHDLYGYPI